MSRRTKQLFSLSLLDLLTSALGAVIFLFIITPKGGSSAAQVRQAMVYFDTTQMKIHGELPDSLLGKSEGDTLYTVLLAYKDLPRPKPVPKMEVPKPVKEKVYVYREPRVKPPEEKAREKEPEVSKKPEAPVREKPTPEVDVPAPPVPAPPTPPVFRGDAPSVPCRLSFEITWPSKDDNVDLFVCRGRTCVYGGNKKDRLVGQWDSGKSRNRIFGNDLRTNQEAVRQFDEIIPGEYHIYAELKESKANKSSVMVKSLIYTKDQQNQQRGESFVRKLELNKGRTHLATVQVNKNGTYTIKRP